MSMYISIGGEEGLSLTSGVFDCIVETTREMFSRGECKCLNFIYESYDDEGQSFIKLDSVDVGCFNVFYKNCKKAKEVFPETELGKLTRERGTIDLVFQQWEEVLKIMREDERLIIE